MGGYESKGQQKGHSLRSQLTQAGFTDLAPAAVVRVKDRKLNFPHNLVGRKIHESRMAIVLSNDTICALSSDPLIVVVPMTHRTDVQLQTDVVIKRSAENGLDSDSLAELHLIQPLLKDDVLKRVGMLSAKDWDNILERFVWMTDRA